MTKKCWKDIPIGTLFIFKEFTYILIKKECKVRYGKIGFYLTYLTQNKILVSENFSPGDEEPQPEWKVYYLEDNK
jgi:hypothetical protein